MGKRQVTSAYLLPTDNQEIIKIIACLNIRKSSGCNDTPTTLIKKAKNSLPFLANSFNECLKSGNYPDILKFEKVILLHKGRFKADLNN